MSDALKADLGEAIDFNLPGGGYFFWLTGRENVDSDALLPFAHKAGVSYRPGTAFSSAGSFSDSLRLSFALYESEHLVESVHRLAAALETYLHHR